MTLAAPAPTPTLKAGAACGAGGVRALRSLETKDASRPVVRSSSFMASMRPALPSTRFTWCVLSRYSMWLQSRPSAVYSSCIDANTSAVNFCCSFSFA